MKKIEVVIRRVEYIGYFVEDAEEFEDFGSHIAAPLTSRRLVEMLTTRVEGEYIEWGRWREGRSKTFDDEVAEIHVDGVRVWDFAKPEENLGTDEVILDLDDSDDFFLGLRNGDEVTEVATGEIWTVIGQPWQEGASDDGRPAWKVRCDIGGSQREFYSDEVG